MLHKTIVLWAGLLVSAGSIPSGASYAQNGAPISARCVQLPAIDHTEVVGDRNILFYMKDNKIYQNALPHACPGLRADQPFMYRVVLNQLCDSDVVTVLERWGFGYTPGQSCLLGEFTPIDAAAADALKAAEKAP
jgi:hypothetical protein